MTEQEQIARARYPGIDPEFGVRLVRCDELRAKAREHRERARLLRAQREELERRYFGRRFILIRF